MKVDVSSFIEIGLSNRVFIVVMGRLANLEVGVHSCGMLWRGGWCRWMCDSAIHGELMVIRAREFTEMIPRWAMSLGIPWTSKVTTRLERRGCRVSKWET